MADVEELDFDNPLEEDDALSETPPGGGRLHTEQADPEIESLYGKYKRGKLIVQADFQRQFVWDTTKASRLIESALMGIPLPVIYLSEENDGKEYVIDGQQRLTSFFSFIDGTFPDAGPFRLTGLKVFPDLTRKTFQELSTELQDRLRYCKVRTITFRKESDPELKFEVFERLNTGAVSLNDQELRNCIYRGPLNDLVKELSIEPDFVTLLGLKRPDKRMKDIELVLRFSAFHHATYLNFRPPMKKFLNTEADKYRHIDREEADALRVGFKTACASIRSLLGEHAFKRFYKGNQENPNGYWEPKKFNASLYDILMYSFAREDKNRVYQHLDALRESLIDLMTSDQEFIDAIELSTSSVQAITKRFDKWRFRVQSILGVGKREERCFSRALKDGLFRQDPTCAICSQRIVDVDDSAVDHVEHVLVGGADDSGERATYASLLQLVKTSYRVICEAEDNELGFVLIC